MVFLPSADDVSRSFDPHGNKGSQYWIASKVDDSVTQAVNTSLSEAVDSMKPPKGGIQVNSTQYFMVCGAAGAAACGPTHAAVTPLDLVKCRRQVDSSLYKSNVDGWKTIVRTEGAGGVLTGFGATFIGYSFQGLGKYGFYEYFKYKYTQLAGEELASKYKTGIYLAGSASAEFLADIFLCPWEAIKVKTQTTIPPYASNAFDGFKKIVNAEGAAGLYKGIGPLWFRQIPYTMVKFATFENAVAAIYRGLPKKKEEYSFATQTAVSFTGGFGAGVLCAIVSHPPDVLVSQMNAEREAGESMMAATSRIYGKIGFKGLWNGLPMRIAMIGLLTGSQWMLYDTAKVSMGIPTTGGH